MPNDAALRAALTEVAQLLQVAILDAAQLRRNHDEEPGALEATLDRAVRVLKRLQPLADTPKD